MKGKPRVKIVFTPQKKSNKEKNSQKSHSPQTKNIITNNSQKSHSPQTKNIITNTKKNNKENNSHSPSTKNIITKTKKFSVKILAKKKPEETSNSLNSFFEIISSEQFFNLQIISYLPVDIFLSELKTKTSNFVFINHESQLNSLKINVFDTFIKSNKPKNIFYNSNYNFSFVPIFYRKNVFENEEISLENIKNELLNINEEESVVLMSCKLKRFSKIIDHLVNIDLCFSNTGYTQMVLNSLVKKGYLKRTNDLYKVIVGRDVLVDLAEKFNINKAFLE